jgi:hypothetical protein
MNEIFRTSTKQFEPASFGGNYLYDQYGKIVSFLNFQSNNSLAQRLAKPELKDGMILWYADFQGPMSLLQDTSEETQEQIKSAFYSWRKEMEDLASNLTNDRQPERKTWGQLLNTLLLGIDIVTNGQDWCVIWGWNFRSFDNQYLLPQIHTPIQSPPFNAAPTVVPIEPIPAIPASNYEGDSDNDTEAPVVQEIHHHHYHNAPKGRNTLGFFERIKRGLRWFVYRFWALLLLIMIILIVLCLCKRCSKCNSCESTEKYNQQIEQIEQQLKDRCK